MSTEAESDEPIKAPRRFQTMGGCTAYVDIDLISDDYEGAVPHAFMCLHTREHEGPHAALVTWLPGEDD